MFLLFFKSLIKTSLHCSSECESNTNVEAIILTNEHTKIQVTIFTADAPTLTNLIELGWDQCIASFNASPVCVKKLYACQASQSVQSQQRSAPLLATDNAQSAAVI